MRNILEIRDLQVHYGGIEAVWGFSLDVPEGEIVTLIGANGAGKSSTLRAIAGLVKPSAGKISFLDEDITGMDSSLIVSKGITLVPEGRRIFPDMTVLEKVIYLADFIEPTRDFPGVDALRRTVWEDLDRGLLMGLEMTVEEMEEMGNPIHVNTLAARDYLKGKTNEGKAGSGQQL